MAGIDISLRSIRLTRKACAERRISFEGQVSDMTTLPWADSMFDAALSISTIHHHRREGIIQTLGQVRRVLKPGGCCWSIFLVRTPSTIACCASGPLPGRLPRSNPIPLSISVLISTRWMMTSCLTIIATKTTYAICCFPSKSSGSGRPCATRRMARA